MNKEAIILIMASLIMADDAMYPPLGRRRPFPPWAVGKCPPPRRLLPPTKSCGGLLPSPTLTMMKSVPIGTMTQIAIATATARACIATSVMTPQKCNPFEEKKVEELPPLPLSPPLPQVPECKVEKVPQSSSCVKIENVASGTISPISNVAPIPCSAPCPPANPIVKVETVSQTIPQAIPCPVSGKITETIPQVISQAPAPCPSSPPLVERRMEITPQQVISQAPAPCSAPPTAKIVETIPQAIPCPITEKRTETIPQMIQGAPCPSPPPTAKIVETIPQQVISQAPFSPAPCPISSESKTNVIPQIIAQIPSVVSDKRIEFTPQAPISSPCPVTLEKRVETTPQAITFQAPASPPCPILEKRTEVAFPPSPRIITQERQTFPPLQKISVVQVETVPQAKTPCPIPLEKRVETVPQLKISQEVASPSTPPCQISSIPVSSPPPSAPIPIIKVEREETGPQISIQLSSPSFIPSFETSNIPTLKKIVPCPVFPVPISKKVEIPPQVQREQVNIPMEEMQPPTAVMKEVEIAAPFASPPSVIQSFAPEILMIPKVEMSPQAPKLPCPSSMPPPLVKIPLISEFSGQELPNVPTMAKTIESMMTKLPRLPKELSSIIYGVTTSTSSCTTTTSAYGDNVEDNDDDDLGMISEQNVDYDDSANSANATFIPYGGLLLIVLLLPCLI